MAKSTTSHNQDSAGESPLVRATKDLEVALDAEREAKRYYDEVQEANKDATDRLNMAREMSKRAKASFDKALLERNGTL